MAVYEKIAQAESHVHGVPVTEIHFHEVGTMDALADITAVCFLLEQLGAEKIIASPVQVGFGKTARPWAAARAHPGHGRAAAGGAHPGREHRRGAVYPTGAALIRQFVSRLWPHAAHDRGAHGLRPGPEGFPAANCLRAMLGQG